jgi:hypothetical protein
MSPRQKQELDAHLVACPLCRAEFDAEENLAHGFRESFKAAAASVFSDTEKETFGGREISISSKVGPIASIRVAQKQHVFRWLAAGSGAAIILAVLILGPHKPGKRGAFPTAAMEAQLPILRSDDLPDPFQDWIEKRMIITVKDKSAGTTEKYLTDREGTVRRIDATGRN